MSWARTSTSLGWCSTSHSWPLSPCSFCCLLITNESPGLMDELQKFHVSICQQLGIFLGWIIKSGLDEVLANMTMHIKPKSHWHLSTLGDILGLDHVLYQRYLKKREENKKRGKKVVCYYRGCWAKCVGLKTEQNNRVQSCTGLWWTVEKLRT